MRFLRIILLCFLCLWAHVAMAFSVIRDTEIEETVLNWVQQIFKAAGLAPENASIVLINDPSLNAFVAGGQTIFIHTGLFMNSESVDDVMFVLSHETGHIVGGHITRGIAAMEKAQTATLISTILGGVLAVASGRPDAGIAIMIGSQGSALGQFMSYRQTEESSADRTAVDVMQKLGYSMKGFLNIMQNLRRLERLNASDDEGYLRTHPFTQNRINDLDRFTKNAPEVKKDIKFERVKAKLAGFMLKPIDVISRYKGNSFTDRYARAIALYQKRDLTNSFQLLDELIKENPNDAYLHELRGQFAFEKGQMTESIRHYEKANQLKPHQPLIEISLAQAYLEEKSKANAQKALSLLTRAIIKEPDIALAWRLMATAYHHLGKELEADYAMVEYDRASNDLKKAQKRAKNTLEKMNKSHPYYQRLKDIVALNSKDKNN